MNQWPLAEEESQKTGREPGWLSAHIFKIYFPPQRITMQWLTKSPHKSLQQIPNWLFLPVHLILFNEEIPLSGCHVCFPRKESPVSHIWETLCDASSCSYKMRSLEESLATGTQQRTAVISLWASPTRP